MKQLKTPDVTPAQLVAIVSAIIGVAVAFGAPITDAQSAALVGLAGVVASALLVGDAVIRNGRARVAAAATAAAGPRNADGSPAAVREQLDARIAALEARPAPVDLSDLSARVAALEAAEGAGEGV